jgi:c-di-GMP-binding flagellar brake protein YcgR
MLTRKHDRFSTCFDPVSASFSGEAQGIGKLYDISYGGCKLESSTRPPIGASVALRFRIAEAEQPIVIQAGAVVWSVPKNYFGVSFVSLQPHEERALNRYLTLLNDLFLNSPGELPE